MPLVEEVRVIVDRGPLQIIAGHEVAANFNGKVYAKPFSIQSENAMSLT